MVGLRNCRYPIFDRDEMTPPPAPDGERRLRRQTLGPQLHMMVAADQHDRVLTAPQLHCAQKTRNRDTDFTNHKLDHFDKSTNMGTFRQALISTLYSRCNG